MSDEKEFDRALRLAGNFTNIYLNFNLRHPTLPGQYIEVDNLAQRDETIFVFEGKYGDEDHAVNQLKIRYNSLKIFKLEYLKRGLFQDYNNIRLFYYNMKNKVLSEYNLRGNKISSKKFNDLNELAQVLRNI